MSLPRPYRGRPARTRAAFRATLAGVSAAALLAAGFAGVAAAPAGAEPVAAEPEAAAEPVATGSEVFPGNDGQPHEVSFDEHSFTVDGERLNVWSGEFHYWRLPSPEHWRDLFQKIRANGFNAVSLYFFWGYHQNELGGDFDFSGVKDIDRLLTMAAEEGLYVIARPGPYVNAEISMGGLPAYLTNTPDDGGNPGLRTNANLDASLEWIQAFDEIASRHQVTDGSGSILLYQVENEMLDENPKRVEFMAELAEQVRADGITVPIFHNDYGMGGRYNPAKPGAAQDMGLDFYAYDNYPMGFNCSAGRGGVADFEANLRGITSEGPNFITEAQGGAFSPWGADFGFERCYNFTDPSFVRQYGVNNIANGVTAFNYYMAFGGTNWGWTGSPSSGYTSYDYGAAITEDRQLTEKFTAQRELGYFINAVPQLTSMEPAPRLPIDVEDGASVNGYQRIATEQQEGSATGNGSRFLGFRHNNSNATDTTRFTTQLNLGEGEVVEHVEVVNDSDERITYEGAWSHDSGVNWTAGAIEGDESYAKEDGASATFEFTGSGISLISSKSNNHGKADIYIDGEKAGSTNTCIASGSYTSEFQTVAFSTDGLDPREPHTIEVRVLGEVGCPDDNLEPGTNVAIDAFKVTPPRYTVDDTDDDGLVFSGDGWETAECDTEEWACGNYLDTETLSDTTGDYVEYTFTGTGIQIIAPQSADHGHGQVEIDGEAVGTTNTFRPAQNASKEYVAFEQTGLSDDEHTIRVTVTGEKDPESEGTFVSIDAFNVIEAADVDEGDEVEGPTFERVPQQEGTYLTLHGRDALAMVADYQVGEHELYYTTSQPVGNLPTAGGRLLTLDGYAGDDGETVLHYGSQPEVTTIAGAEPEVTWDADDGTLRLNYTHDAALYQVTADGLAEPLLLRITDRDEMNGMWQVDGARGEGNETVEVFGADLVRTVTFDGDVAHLSGSMTEAGQLEVHVPAGITEVTWNGAPLGEADTGPGEVVTGEVPGPEPVDTPELSTWRVAEENPEATVAFDDSDWLVADDTTAENHRQGPGPDTGVVLDSNHYRYFEGDVWYRAHYTADDSGSITLNGNGATGGPGHGRNSASMLVWVNGAYAGAAMAEGADKTFEIPEGAAGPGESVVLSVLVRNQGQNLDWSDNGLSKQNRGLWNARLNNDGPVTWKIQGARDVDTPIDSARTLYNNGGLYGERAGWYLPGYPDEAWAETTTMHAGEPGVAWYRTSFPLDVPEGQDTSFALKVNAADFGDTFAERTDASRTVMFVNGWNVGTWVGYVGPQSQFTIPSGFLDMNGENEVAIAVTAEVAGAGPDSIELVQVGNMTGGMTNVQNEAPELAGYDLAAELTPAVDEPTVAVSGDLTTPELAGDALTEVVLDWGDGSEPESLDSTGFEAAHTYGEDGEYVVTVTARETVGGAHLAERTFTVTVEDGQIVVDDGGDDDADADTGGADDADDAGGDDNGADDASGDDSGADDAGADDAGADNGADDAGADDSGADTAGQDAGSADDGGVEGGTGATGAAEDGTSGADGTDPGDGLPSTGVQLGALGLATVLLAAGLAVLQRRRSMTAGD